MLESFLFLQIFPTVPFPFLVHNWPRLLPPLLSTSVFIVYFSLFYLFLVPCGGLSSHVGFWLLLLLPYPSNGIFSRTTWVSQYQEGKSSHGLNEARDDRACGCSGISWTICKQSAPRSRQITTATPHNSNFYRLDALSDAQATVSKHTMSSMNK